ncbi:uncharacterized protein LOC126761925 [Bactrocera neohumeralis]|uniref:uncharacterized protein LOC126761925 n=1 Tax=Bactrocera neohumeralis TaxID=98809 RepID=UPI002165ECA4|nr:uncharacterized protein LOC126761925 [Bactrocera neohumeralis]
MGHYCDKLKVSEQHANTLECTTMVKSESENDRAGPDTTNAKPAIINKTDVTAHHKIVRETKVLVKKVQQTVCRISGESSEDFHTELAVLMPMQTLDAVFDLEEKILEKNYEDAVITYLFTLKGTSGDIGEVMKRVFGDEVLSLFNWDGRCGKKSLSELKIVSVALFEIFKLHGRIDFEKEVRKSVEQSHNRQKQKRYLLNKKTYNKISIKHHTKVSAVATAKELKEAGIAKLQP